jgi:hypothetical protein
MAPITECVLFGSAGVSPVVWRAFNGGKNTGETPALLNRCAILLFVPARFST